MLHGDDHPDAVKGQQGAQQQGVSDRVEPLIRLQMDGVVQVGERVVPVHPGGRITEHGDHPECGRGDERDREDPVAPDPRENREQGTDVCGHEKPIR
ncbi:hypothetical protein GCM10027612_53120 [Microbispora bryophytorum subsp. camponoti]